MWDSCPNLVKPSHVQPVWTTYPDRFPIGQGKWKLLKTTTASTKEWGLITITEVSRFIQKHLGDEDTGLGGTSWVGISGSCAVSAWHSSFFHLGLSPTCPQRRLAEGPHCLSRAACANSRDPYSWVIKSSLLLLWPIIQLLSFIYQTSFWNHEHFLHSLLLESCSWTSRL